MEAAAAAAGVICSDCVKWSRKYSKIEAGRNALRQTIAILEKRVDELIQQNATLNKELGELRSQVDFEKEARSKDYDVRVALEKEIESLKSEVCSLRESRCSEAPDTEEQVNRVSDLEKEILRLKELLDEEKSRADAALRDAQVGKTEVAKAWESAKLEKSRAEKEKARASKETKRAQEYKIQLNALSKEAADVRSQLTLAMSKSEEVSIRLEAERKKAIAEQKQADLMKAEAEKQKILVGEYEKKLADEKHRADILSCQLNEERRKNEEMLKTVNELQKNTNSLRASSNSLVMGNKSPEDKGVSFETVTTNAKTEKTKTHRRNKGADSTIDKVVELRSLMQPGIVKSVEEKCHGYTLTDTLPVVKATVETSAHMNKLISRSHNELILDAQPENVTRVSPSKSSRRGHELKLSKEQMKIAKKQAKRIVKKYRNSNLKKELEILKQDFLQFANTLEFLDLSLSSEAIGSTLSVEAEAQQSPNLRGKERKFLDLRSLHPKRECKKSSYVLNMPLNMASNHPNQALFPPECGINAAESTSLTETNARLKPPAGGSYEELYVSSVKNSSAASFSDSWSMNSQGKFDASTTSSNLADGSSLWMTDTRLFGDVTKLMNSGRPAMMSTAGVKSLGSSDSVGDPVRSMKRKRIPSLLDSSQNALFDSKKKQMQMEENISILLTELQNPMATPVETNSEACNGQYDRSGKSCKKKKTLRKQKVSSQCLPNGSHSVGPNIENPGLDGATADISMDATATVEAYNQSNGAMVCKSANIASLSENDHNPSECFDQLTDGDNVILLDLDDRDDERRYRVARQNFLSPSLPDIEFKGCNVYSVDGVEHTIKDLSNAGASTPNCISNVNHVDASRISNKPDTWAACKPMVLGGTADSFSVKECNEHGPSDMQVEGPILEAHMSKQTRYLTESLVIDDFANLCVVHSETIDRGNLSRVFYAIRKGASQCHLSSLSCVLLKKLLDNINNNDLPPKEKACVFLSMILAGSHLAAARELSHPITEYDVFPRSYVADIFSVINDVDIRNCLEQTLCLHELLRLVREFIIEGRIWVCLTPVKNLPESSDSNVLVPVDGMKLLLEAASTEQLVVASNILASLCVSLDDIDFIVLLSYDLIRLRKNNYSAVLSVIHVFAQLAGRKFLTSTSNCLLTGVVKSLVLLLESSQSPCSKCPFSEEAASLDSVLFLLLERLQSLMEMAKTQVSGKDRQEEVSYHKVSDVRGCSSIEDTFTLFVDILSLLELIAHYVSWDIISSKVVPQLLLKLEASDINSFSIGIITILGQLGRLGVSANGLEDIGVVKIRCQLTRMLSVDSSRNLTFPIQVAIVCSLLKFVNLDPDSLLCSADMSALVDKASSAFQLRSWFTSLREDQQTIIMGILRDAPPM